VEKGNGSVSGDSADLNEKAQKLEGSPEIDAI